MLKRIKKLFSFRKKEEESYSAFDQINSLYESLNDDDILLKIGEDLVPHGNFICKIISNLREEVKDECGFIFPQIHVCDYSCLQENEFVLYIKGNEAGQGFLIPTEKGIEEELYEVLKTAIYNSIDKLFSNSITEKYIEAVRGNNSWLIWNLTCKLSLTEIKIILLDIVQKGKSLNNIDNIFEQMGEQVLTNGKFNDCLAKYNPHIIAERIAKEL